MHLDVDVYTDCTQGERDRVLLRNLSNGEFVFMLVDGSEAAFAHSYQPVMDLVKESFTLSFSNSSGSIQKRLSQASVAVEEAIHQRFPSSEQFGEETYSATFLALVKVESQAFIAWIGSQQAKLLRKDRFIQATVPHITITSGLDRRKFIITSKVMSTVNGETVEQPEIEGPWDLSTGDTLVIADFRLFTLGSDDQIASIIINDPTEPAKALVNWAESIEHHFAQSAIVIQIREN